MEHRPRVKALGGGRSTSAIPGIDAFSAALAAEHPGRFGYFATLPMPDAAASAAEAWRALDELGADGVTLLADNQGAYLGTGGQENVQPFAADFLLDSTRAAYLLVRSGIVRRHPCGFAPYASHRTAVAIAGETGRSPLDILDDLRGPASAPPCPPCRPPPAPATSSSAATDPWPRPRSGGTSRTAWTAGPIPARWRASTAPTSKPVPAPGRRPESAPVRFAAVRLRQSAQRAGARLFFRLVQSGTR
ncbi:amidohydrolase family protein [Streptomyces sp. NPDC001604]|uniref:amidohydrolase family protein n=1 Tax=Streptomyces sp. NPDC001604 TaxID=3364593 RepID=UPI0036A8461C